MTAGQLDIEEFSLLVATIEKQQKKDIMVFAALTFGFGAMVLARYFGPSMSFSGGYRLVFGGSEDVGAPSAPSASWMTYLMGGVRI